MDFYINKLAVNGKEREPSIVEFTQGLNIIIGPSNTGKSLIYNPLHDYEEYTQITLYITADDKELSIERNIDSNTVKIHSTITNIESGIYNIKGGNYNKSLNSIILKLLGITERHEIVKNKSFGKQELTWRSFYHMFFIDEDRIIAEASPLLKGDYVSKTSSLSILIFLLYNKDFEHIRAHDRNEIKHAKRQAVENYINNEIENFSKRTAQLETELRCLSENDIKIRIAAIIDKIENTQNMLNNSMEEAKKIVKEIYSKNETLAQDTILFNRYKLLETQYNSDLLRLNFIVDGQINYEKSKETDCPFCHNKILIKEKPDYINASLYNYKKIKMQISDLSNATQELTEEIERINNEIKILNNQKATIDQKIDKQLKPQIEDLKNQLQVYENYIERNNEIKILRNICINKNKYIIDQKKIKNNNADYNPIEYLEDMFFTEFSDTIKNILQEGHFENLNTVLIDKKTIDIVLNGQKKSSNGKGYKAYFNSITAIALISYLSKNAVYKHGIFEILMNFPIRLQTIIIENEIPEINYKSANIIQFTKNKTQGRYGFLNGVYNL